MSDEDYDYVEEESWIGGFFSGSPKYVLGFGAVLVWFLYFDGDAEYNRERFNLALECRQLPDKVLSQIRFADMDRQCRKVGEGAATILKNPREMCVRGGHRILMYDDLGIAGSVAPQRICAYDGEKIIIPSAYEQNAYLIGAP